MNLTCPSCGATFFIEAAHLGPAGRRVRCGDCRHTWRQKPVAEDQAPAPAPASEPAADPGAEQAAAKAAAKPFAPSEAAAASAAPEPAEPSTPEPPAKAAPAADPGTTSAVAEATPGERVSRRAFSKPTRPQPKRSLVPLAAGWTIYAVVIAGLASGFYYGRAPLVEMAPEMSRLYDLVGLKEEVVEPDLELRELKSVRRLIEGERFVIIEGLVVNPSNRERQVPPLSASVTDAEGNELDSWTFHAESASLAPGGTTHFETVAKNPPREGNVFINFAAEE